MLDLILYIAVLTAGTGVGYLTAKPYENRVSHLDDLILTLKVLQAEMSYRCDPLPVLLDRIGCRSRDKSGEFLTAVVKCLLTDNRCDLYECWKQSVNEVYGESALTDEDRFILSQGGIELGKTDLENHEALFIHLFTGLEKQRKEADEERKTKGRIYRALWTSAGVMAVIVLL